MGWGDLTARRQTRPARKVESRSKAGSHRGRHGSRRGHGLRKSIGRDANRLRDAEGCGLKPKRIVYVQYTNPAAYPPLIHSSRILASRGWRVLFLATGSDGSGQIRFENNEASIRIAKLPFARPGWRQKL